MRIKKGAFYSKASTVKAPGIIIKLYSALHKTFP